MADRLKRAVTDVRDRINTLLDGSDNLFKTVTLFNNQIEREQNDGSYVISKPAILIELQFLNPVRLLNGLTQEDILWRFHIVHEETDNTEGSLDANYNVISFRDRLKAALTRFQPSYCGQMFFDGEEMDYDHNNIYHYKLDMKCGFIDTKGSPYDPDSTEWQDATINNLEIDAHYTALQKKIIVVNSNGTAQSNPTQEYINTVTGDWMFSIPDNKMLAIVVVIPEANGTISLGLTGTGSEDILPLSPLTANIPMVVNIYHYALTDEHLFITSDVTAVYKIYYF